MGIDLEMGRPEEPIRDRISRGERVYSAIVTGNLDGTGLHPEIDPWFPAEGTVLPDEPAPPSLRR